jgi:hypothetical protein
LALASMPPPFEQNQLNWPTKKNVFFEKHSPPDWTKKDNTSPSTNIFVKREGRIGEWFSPPVKRMMRPKTM